MKNVRTQIVGETSYEKIVDGVTGEFVANSHGYFCNNWNGLQWPWKKTCQLAASSEEDAVRNLLNAIEEVEA
jgi:hypothetical protein